MRSIKLLNLAGLENSRVSRMAYSLLIPLILLSNLDNEVSEKEVSDKIGWISDYRTWDKYWNELMHAELIVRLDTDRWLINPNAWHASGASYINLQTKWHEANYATR